MNISGYEFQVIFCAFILLGLASVALVVDYLKGMNEKLRERHIELMARHDVVVHQVEEDNTRLLRALAEQSKAFREMNQRSIAFNMVSAERSQPEITLQPVEEDQPQAIEAEPVLAIAGPVAVAEPEPVASDIEAAEKQGSLPSNVIRIRLKPAEPEAQPEAAAKVESDEPDFEKFLEELVHEFDATDQTNGQPAQAPSEALNAPGVLEIPAGIHPPSVLSQLLDRDDYFFGLVLSVGINDYLRLDAVHGHAASEELLHTVDALMGEIAGESGFCSRPSDGEFVLIYPLLNGPEAQQKVASISERLWDYQMQTLGTFTAVFSWGACEGKRQALSTVLQTATENMIETKGTRSAPEASPTERATA